MTRLRSETGVRPRDTGVLDVDGLPQPPDWTIDALCAQIGPELFFADGKGKQFHDAKRICSGCEVRVKCLEYALSAEAAEDGPRHGIFGGLSPQERAMLQRERDGGNACRDCGQIIPGQRRFCDDCARRRRLATQRRSALGSRSVA